MLRSFLAVLFVLLVGGALGGAYWQFVVVAQQEQSAAGSAGRRGAAAGPIPVEVQEVRVGPAETTVTAVGTLLSNESVVLEPEVSGRVTDINFEEGAPVRRGEVLVELDDDVEKAEVAQAEAALQLARANFQRASDLRKTSAGTQRAYDEAQAELRRSEAAVELAKSRLAKRWIKAPFDAVAGLRLVSLGDYLVQGQPIVNLEQIDPLKVDFRVPEVFVGVLRDDQPISVTVDAFPGEVFPGTILAINPLIDQAGRSIVVRARIENPGRRLRPGLFARVTVTLAERQEALFVPEQAVVPQIDRQFVYKVVDQGADEGKVAKQVEVKLGHRRRGEVEILEGLERGDIVVTAGLLKIREGAPVTIVQPVPPDAESPAPPTAGSGVDGGRGERDGTARAG